MERNYTIPVNEAFDKTDICPICTLRQILESNELDLILGASMMEPDIRVETNKLGFCDEHFRKMAELFTGQIRLRQLWSCRVWARMLSALTVRPDLLR